MVTVANFTTGVVDTSGKFATSFVDTVETTLMLFSWAWWKMTHKNPEAKKLVTLSSPLFKRLEHM
jgi:hypothetical protein